MFRLAVAIFLALTTAAAANMPPRKYDNANNGMSIAQIKKTLKDKRTDYVRVELGHAGDYCEGNPRYGCMIEYTDGSATIVYSFDPKEGVEGTTAKNVIRHEIGHRKGWPCDHPNARP